MRQPLLLISLLNEWRLEESKNQLKHYLLNITHFNLMVIQYYCFTNLLLPATSPSTPIMRTR